MLTAASAAANAAVAEASAAAAFAYNGQYNKGKFRKYKTYATE